MHIAIMGTGGVGGYFGARLALGGSDVSFIARGAHLDAIRNNGLHVESAAGDLHIATANATDDPSTIGPVDLIILGVKLWDTETAARAILPMLGQNTAVISLQNGVQKDDALRRILPNQAVMGGVCYIAATIAKPGVIRHSGTMKKLVFGEYDGSRSQRAQEVLDACLRAGIDAEISTDIRKTIWEKFVFLVGFSGTTTSIRKPIGPIRSTSQTREFLLDAMHEVVAVGRAQGVQLAEDFAANRLAFCDSLPAEMTSSMYNDLEYGNRLEVEWLSGDVVERGKTAGVPTPVNRAIHDVLTLHAGGHQAK